MGLLAVCQTPQIPTTFHYFTFTTVYAMGRHDMVLRSIFFSLTTYIMEYSDPNRGILKTFHPEMEYES